ncbi:MAG: hypothetical protein NWF02_01025 [Candidatus Bathyarchaeota archaeon]|nr:hypothetical protein [Candidatus Bathyarchaeum sp.]
MINKLKNETIDKENGNKLLKKFRRNKINFEMSLKEYEYSQEIMYDLDFVETKLELAIELAWSNYKIKEKEIHSKNIENVSNVIEKIVEKYGKK